MNRLLSLAVAGFAGLALAAAPQVSQAQVPVGVAVRVGPASFSYQPSYAYVAPGYVAPAPVVVGPSVVVSRPLYNPWYWDGHRWLRHERFEHYRYGHRR